MKEVITVELEKEDVEAAIEDMLKDKGYKVEKVEFKCSSSVFVVGSQLEGVIVTVTKQ